LIIGNSHAILFSKVQLSEFKPFMVMVIMLCWYYFFTF